MRLGIVDSGVRSEGGRSGQGVCVGVSGCKAFGLVTIGCPGKDCNPYILNPPAPKGFICEEELPEGEPDEELPPGAGMGSDWARRATEFGLEAGGRVHLEFVPQRNRAGS